MLNKQPATKHREIKSLVKYFVISEVFIVLGCYALYSACNRSQETRKYFYERRLLRPITEFYYTAGEKFGTSTVRAYDLAVWAAQAKLKEERSTTLNTDEQ